MLFYIGYYADNANAENRHIYLSAVTKMQYIIDTLDTIGVPLQVVSCSNTRDPRGYAGRVEQISKNVSVKYFRTFGKRNLLTKLLDIGLSRGRLFLYLMKHVAKEDTLLVYHSLAYGKVIHWVKKLKKCRFIFEVEEIYSDVHGKPMQKKKEIALCRDADAFIFPTQLLSEVVNLKGKPYVIIHGTYGVELDRKVSFADDKIHVVYAGTLDPRKGGGAAAVAAAEFLPADYHIHILGFGNDKEVAAIQEFIGETNAKGRATVTYEGVLSGEEYITFLQKCQIGLSTQNPDAAFNATSFPSKILSYMANGLRVVTIRIPAIEGSAVGKDLYYYDKQAPEEIAKAIMQVDFKDNYDSRKKIEELDKQFCEEIKSLLGENDNAESERNCTGI